jgi:hypothetical protein
MKHKQNVMNCILIAIYYLELVRLKAKVVPSPNNFCLI